MIKLALTFVLANLTSASVFAGTLTYVADFSQMQDMDETTLDICGYPFEYNMNAEAPLGPTVISTLFTYGDITTTRIQSTNGAISGGNSSPKYTGDYREKVYLVKQVIPGAYSPGIYNRVEVTTYGSTSAPKGFVVSKELLNHRYSAELAEESLCGNIYYKLINASK